MCDDDPIIPPPSSVDVEENTRVVLYTAQGHPLRRTAGFTTQPWHVVCNDMTDQSRASAPSKES